MKLEISVFGGRQPKTAIHLLEDYQAQIAHDTLLTSGSVQGWKQAEKLTDISETDIKTLYRWYHDATSEWLISNLDLDFVGSPLASDIWDRMYFSGASEPRYLANDIISTPFNFSTDFLKLGVPAPAAAITTASGYSTDSGYRAYFYTYVSRYGEEGSPSPLKEITNYGSGSVTLTGFTEPPADRGLTEDVGGYKPKVYIYRTNATGTGTAEFQFVKSFDVADVSVWATHAVVDDVSDANLGEVCPSTYWLPPDANLEGFISLPNGAIAGFKENELWFSETYYPHAWPLAYRLTFDYTIIGISVFGTTVVVLTEGYPYLVYGATLGSLEKVKLASHYPCSSRQSIVSTEHGVLYASSEGLIAVTQNGAALVSTDLFDRTTWQTFYPTKMRAVFWAGHYIMQYYQSSDIYGGFGFDVKNNILFDIYYYDAMFVDKDGVLYVVKRISPGLTARAIYEWEGDQYNYKMYTWKSKQFILPADIRFSVGRIILDKAFYNDILDLMEENEILKDQNQDMFDDLALEGDLNDTEMDAQELNGDSLIDLTDYDMSPEISLKLYVENELHFTKIVSAADRATVFKLPKTFLGRKFEFEVSGFIPVKQITIATGSKELM